MTYVEHINQELKIAQDTLPIEIYFVLSDMLKCIQNYYIPTHTNLYTHALVMHISC